MSAAEKYDLVDNHRLEEVRIMAGFLMKRHAPPGWTFDFHSKRMSLGTCRFKTRQILLNEVTASTATNADVIEIILHEIAHAIVGPGHGHDDVWRETARQIGCKELTACATTAVGEEDVRGAKYIAICNGCGARFYRFRKPKRPDGRACRNCGQVRGKLVFRPIMMDTR